MQRAKSGNPKAESRPSLLRSPPSAPERLATSVQYVKGVGPQRAKLLERLGIQTVADLLFYLPRDYQDLSDVRPIADLEEDKVQSVRGRVVERDYRAIGPRRSIVGVLIHDGHDHLRAVWFNQPYVYDRFGEGDEVLFSGKPQRRANRWQMNNPRVQWRREADAAPAESIVPVYGLTEGVSAGMLRRIVHHAVEKYAHELPELFPEPYRREHDLLPLPAAVQRVHLPQTLPEISAARRRIVYEEFFLLQVALALRKQARDEYRHAPALPLSAKIDARIRRLFQFSLTAGQNRAIAEIVHDMASGRPMSRLLQGEVGSGKTAVAVYALLLAIAHGHQAVLMAPTEVLAQQHWQTLEQYLAHSRVRRVLLTGAFTTAERRRALEQIRRGEIDLVVGTQAVVQKDVRFHRLGLVVIDEQHKFGVRQRAHFHHQGEDPHYLVMTATPIPRTLCMTLFGDLDISVIDDLPPGRQKVRTYLVEPPQRERCWEFVRQKLREGRQAYVVCPWVGEAEEQREGRRGRRGRGRTGTSGSLWRPPFDPSPLDSDVTDPHLVRVPEASAQETYERLRKGELADFTLALLHGRMSDQQKRRIMHRFRSGQVQVLVCTTVIEVGIDVPTATVMLIEQAERFGLSQLHQLRGRIARGSYPGFCFLMSETDNAPSRQRLDVLTRTQDGFRIAEADFRLRGPGEIFGTRQHGLPPLRAGDVFRDQKLLAETRRDAFRLIQADPGLRRLEYQALRQAVLERYGAVLELADVG